MAQLRWAYQTIIKRFESYGWKFIEINGHNEKQISKAILKHVNQVSLP